MGTWMYAILWAHVDAATWRVDIYRQGFHSDDDEEVLEGSCALEFTLTHAGMLS